MTTLKLISPVDGSVYLERAAASLEEAQGAIAAARAVQKAWARRPIAERVAIVQDFVAKLLAMKDEMVPEIAWQMGRPVRYGGEFGGVRERADYMASIAESALASIKIEDSPEFRRFIAREPLGLVMVIAPWNYPYLTAINTIAPALMAGNAVLLKHATQTLRVGERFQMAADASELPRGLFSNLALDHTVTEKILSAGAVDFLNFTGSVGGGKAMEHACAGSFTGLGLELGGKDPGYVCEDADVNRAVETLMDGAMYNSGQCCCGIERIYVAEPLYDQFVAGAVAFAEAYKLGNPLDPETTLGPMAQTRFADLVRGQTEEAVRAGAKPLIDAKRFHADKVGTPYLAPQVLINVDHSMRVMREESFGPVVGIMKVKNDAEAIALMNDSDYGLTASIWTRDVERAERIGRDIETGTVFMNRCDYLDPALCWTGCKDTGRGGALSVIGFHNLTRPKSYHLRT
ncbi:MAG: aldehyde dehydrogenase family protein [Hyphomonadaceae bacterium]|nr:aldehyde dehydrogenase family protein [Hyphomonadaceae bacterium]